MTIMKTPKTIIIIIPINFTDGFSKPKRKAKDKTKTGVLLFIIAIILLNPYIYTLILK